jgi:hypothetical protein
MTTSGRGGQSPAERQLTFIGRFIDKYFVTQPHWIQSVTFLLFVLLFIYGFINLLNGKYVLKGNLWVEKPANECAQPGGSCITHGKYYDLKWGAGDFVTNSIGEYYITMGLPEYTGALLSGSHAITFIKNEVLVENRPVKINRLAGEFEDVILRLGTNTPAPTAVGSLSLVPEAWAASAPTSGGLYRLLLQGAELVGISSKTTGSFEFLVGGDSIALQDHSASDTPVGQIPLVGNRRLDLDSSFYFPLPGNSLPIAGTVTLTTASSGFFQFGSGSKEEFRLPDQQSVGSPMRLPGSKGSALDARILFSQDVKLFRESESLAQKDQIEADLLNQGFLVRWADPPRGPTAETNSLWSGPDVPFDVVQRLLRMILNEHLPIKQVKYRHNFRSTSNRTEIQIGSDMECDNAPPASPEVLAKAIEARNEGEFLKAIEPLSGCVKASAVTTPKTRKSRTSKHSLH